jgi:hypothetical protein
MVVGLWIDRMDGNGPQRNPALTDAEYEAGLICQMNDNVKALWQAAHDYEYAEISGSAIGLIVLGNLSSKPKCIAVQTWISSIWTLYYTRKPLVTYTWNNTLYDFSSCGSCPHTCPELMEELGF